VQQWRGSEALFASFGTIDQLEVGKGVGAFSAASIAGTDEEHAAAPKDVFAL
jgi:hypothetical protein